MRLVESLLVSQLLVPQDFSPGQDKRDLHLGGAGWLLAYECPFLPFRCKPLSPPLVSSSEMADSISSICCFSNKLIPSVALKQASLVTGALLHAEQEGLAGWLCPSAAPRAALPGRAGQPLGSEALKGWGEEEAALPDSPAGDLGDPLPLQPSRGSWISPSSQQLRISWRSPLQTGQLFQDQPRPLGAKPLKRGCVHQSSEMLHWDQVPVLLPPEEGILAEGIVQWERGV